MKIPVIKKLAEQHTIDALYSAEQAILEEHQPAIEIEGKDEGEQLTHVMAAIEILKYMEKHQAALPEALRHYSSRVRTSIS
jgi:hypothetical protein